MKIIARKLLGYKTEELKNILTGRFILVFDNAVEIQTNDRETLYSSFFWDFHRLYPLMTLEPTHHVRSLLQKENLSSKTHIELLSVIYRDAIKAYSAHKNEVKDDLVRLIYQVTNNLYNAMIHETEKSVMSIDILDFIEVNDHPVVQKAFDELQPTPDSIEKTYQDIMNVILKDKALEKNTLVKSVKSKMVNSNQVLQCVGPRGFVSEVDGAIMAIPVDRSYTQGMRTLFNTIAESRTAAKSLYFSESPLQDSEYFSRRLQLVCMVVEKLHRVDCGSRKYLEWRVKPKIVAQGKEIYPGDLKFLVGKYYLDETSNTLRIISKYDTHLEDTVVKLRSVLYCQHTDPHGVCEVCFGQLSENIADHMNLGHICAATMTRQTTQSVLSTKHLDVSSRSDPIKYTPALLEYFVENTKSTEYKLKPMLKTAHLKLIIANTDLHGFTDIKHTENLDDIDPSRISAIDKVGFSTQNFSDDTPVAVTVEQHGRKAIVSTEFLKYAKKYGWTINSSHAFVFDMSQWDYNHPVLKLPNMEYSFAKHSKQIAEIIESKMAEFSERNKPESPVKTLFELFDLVNSKITVNIALLEVIIYAMMVNNSEENNYSLARNSPKATLGVRDDVIMNRSLSAAYGFEHQVQYVFNPYSFYKDKRPDHPLDVMFCPEDVLTKKHLKTQ
jgi:hypothetical protein